MERSAHCLDFDWPGGLVGRLQTRNRDRGHIFYPGRLPFHCMSLLRRWIWYIRRSLLPGEGEGKEEELIYVFWICNVYLHKLTNTIAVPKVSSAMVNAYDWYWIRWLQYLNYVQHSTWRSDPHTEVLNSTETSPLQSKRGAQERDIHRSLSVENLKGEAKVGSV